MQSTKPTHQKIDNIKSKPPLNKPKSQWKADSSKGGVFDNNIKKGALAQEQRSIRAQSRKSAHSKSKTQQAKSQQDKAIKKKIQTEEKQKQQEIQKLKKLIEQEKSQKEKKDKIYQQKKKQIQKQRQQLLEIERDIAKNKSVKKNIKEPTQSELVANSRTAIRQKQIQQALRNRQKLTQNVPTLGYHPTLIPLLSRASYKIISTHISMLVQLLLDDILIGEVMHLEKVQEQQKQVQQKKKTQQIINDYQQQLKEFVNEVQQIEAKVGNYQTMKFADIYRPRMPEQYYQPRFTYQPQKKMLYVEFTSDQIEELHARSDRFKRFVNSLDDYKKSNLQMFGRCTEEIINEAILNLANELDRGSADFVDLVFRNQFK